MLSIFTEKSPIDIECICTVWPKKYGYDIIFKNSQSYLQSDDDFKSRYNIVSNLIYQNHWNFDQRLLATENAFSYEMRLGNYLFVMFGQARFLDNIWKLTIFGTVSRIIFETIFFISMTSNIISQLNDFLRIFLK